MGRFRRAAISSGLGSLCLLGLLFLGCDALGGKATFKTTSSSMEPTLKEGAEFTVRRLAKVRSEDLPRGTVITFTGVDGTEITRVSRVIAIAGDRLRIDSKKVFLNAAVHEEPYAIFLDPKTFPNQPYLSKKARARDHLKETTVPEGHVFVMGDNRDSSYDSRFYGPIPLLLVDGIVDLEG